MKCYQCDIELSEGQPIEMVWIGKFEITRPEPKLLCAKCSGRIKTT